MLEAPDRDQLLDWLLGRPLAVYDEPRGDLLVHAGLVPEWSPRVAAKLAREVEAVLREDGRTLFDAMYGNKPEKWSDSLRGMDRLRFVINAFTRMRFCRRDGSVDLKMKGKPGEQPAEFLPWFDVPERASRDVRVVCGHWSTLGFKRRPDLLALDTGCVWGGCADRGESRRRIRPRAVGLRRTSGTGRRRRLRRLPASPSRLLKQHFDGKIVVHPLASPACHRAVRGGRQPPPVAERLRVAGRNAVDGTCRSVSRISLRRRRGSRSEYRLREPRGDGSGIARRDWKASSRRHWPSARRDAHRCSGCSRSRENGSPCRGR